LERKVDEAEERYQKRKREEDEEKQAKLEKTKAKDLSSERSNGDKSTSANIERKNL